MPGGIFHIIGIHRLMQLKLLAALFVLPGIIKRQPSLPELRRGFGRELDDFVECCCGLLRLCLEKEGNALPKSGVGVGISAGVPGQGVIAVFAPPLDEAGNSAKGYCLRGRKARS